MPGETGWKLRIGRHSEPGRIYLVTACCFERKRLFSTAELAEAVLNEFSARCPLSSYESLAFVAMPDHIHWLVQLNSSVSLGTIVGRVKGRSAYHINRIRKSHDRVWQAGYHDHALRRDEDIETAGTYLIHNPVRAGLVLNIEEYPFWGSIWHRRERGRG